MSLIKNFFGDSGIKGIHKLSSIVKGINALEEGYEQYSDERLKEAVLELKDKSKNGEDLDILLPDMFAFTREAAKRTLHQRHYDVQLMGGIVLHKGNITEMRTGEGKTLSATLAVSLNALLRKGVHVITVNDYLAKRDAVWMGQIFHKLGFTVGCIVHDHSYRYDPMYKGEKADSLDEKRDALGSFKVIGEFLRPVSRKEAYEADITYGTNNEFGFDWLRDNLEMRKESIRQKEHYFAIVDEVDSVLIDEARTPLIISAPDTESSDFYKIPAAALRMRQLQIE